MKLKHVLHFKVSTFTGLSYDVNQLAISLVVCLKRRLSVCLKLARIPEGRVATEKGDLAKVLHTFIEEEFLRLCAIAALGISSGGLGNARDAVRRRTLPSCHPRSIASRAVIPLSPYIPFHATYTTFISGIGMHNTVINDFSDEGEILHLLTLFGIPATHNTYTSTIVSHSVFVLNTIDGVDDEGETNVHVPVVHFQRYTAAVELEKQSERDMSEVEFEDALEVAGY